jgi:hypothetical protein
MHDCIITLWVYFQTSWLKTSHSTQNHTYNITVVVFTRIGGWIEVYSADTFNTTILIHWKFALYSAIFDTTVWLCFLGSSLLLTCFRVTQYLWLVYTSTVNSSEKRCSYFHKPNCEHPNYTCFPPNAVHLICNELHPTYNATNHKQYAEGRMTGHWSRAVADRNFPVKCTCKYTYKQGQFSFICTSKRR